MTLVNDTPVSVPVTTWVAIAEVAELTPDRGVAALIAGRQVAVFLLADGSVWALDNHDPCSGANVLSRGLVGSVGERATVASPMYKQRFDLATGECLDDPDANVSAWPARVCDGWIEVGVS